MLTEKIKAYNATAVPLGNKPKDPASNPANFNYTWMPWLDMLDKEPNEPYTLTKELWLTGNQLSEDDVISSTNACFNDNEDVNLIEF